MDVAPPPTGTRMQELGDALTVRFRPRRSWGQLAFLTVWLTFWSFAGVAVFAALLHEDWGTRAGLVLWLCGWLFGEAVAIAAIGWQLFGHEVLTVTPEQLEVRKEIGRFARTEKYDVPLVHSIEAARVPGDENEERKDFCLKVSYNDRDVRIGEEMGEREAEYVASTIMERIRPRRWWGEEEVLLPPRVLHLDAEKRPNWGARVFAGIVAAFVLVGIANTLFADDPDTPESSRPSAATTAEPSPPPRAPVAGASRSLPLGQEGFSNPWDYASAMTTYSLASSRTKVLGLPACGEHATWTQWSCTVMGRSTLPPFAGRTLRYRCSAVSTPQPSGRPAVNGVLCGPEHPPAVGR